MYWSRIVRWLRRHRWVLIGVVSSLPVLGLFLYRPIIQSAKPPVRAIIQPAKPPLEDLPDFQSALRFVDQDGSEQAVRLLFRIKQEYPRSALLLFYLSTALDAQQHQWTEAESHFSAALAVPGAENALIAWGKVHPEIVLHLEDFANERLERARNYRTTHFEGILDEDNDRVSKSLEPYYNLARNALRIAESIDPESPKTQYLLAITDELYGDLSAAEQRLSRLINSANSAAETDIGWLFVYRKVRGDIATRWADRLRGTVSSRAAALKALALVQQAEKDLSRCLSHLTDTASPDHPAEEHGIRYLRLRTMLTMVETEIDLGLLPEARAQLRRARRIIDLIGGPRSLDFPPSADKGLTQRLAEVESRLRTAQ